MPSDLIDAELEELLREERPEPTLMWTETMDRRVASGFREEPRPRRRRAWMPAAGAVATAMVAVVVGIGLSGDDAPILEATGDRSAGATQTVPETDAAAENSADTQESAGGSAAAGASADESLQYAVPLSSAARSKGLAPLAPESRARKVVQSAQLTLTDRPGRIDDVADGIIRVTDRLGGYVATSNVSSSRRSGNGYFELKIPVGKLDQSLAELSKLAHVASRTQATEDITGSYDSARARLRELRVARASLLRQLGKADTANETASLRAQLRVVRGQLSAATDQLERVNRRAAYANVTVTLESRTGAAVPSPDDDGTWSPGDAVKDALRVLEVALGVGVIALAVAVPLGLLGLAGAMTARVAGRRRRERALDAA